MDDSFANPVLPGFFPDPSIVRVGADYYLVNSTFQYFPAIVISHSRDLVHWQQIGHVFTDPQTLDLGGFIDGCGIWAPDISYHDGWFYIFYCLVQLTPDRSVNVRGNFMVRARHVLGPYSAPVQLTHEGNDPSHFVDVDGTHYLLYAAGIPRGKGVKIVRLADDCSHVVGAPSWLEFEPEKRAPEGPHLLHRDGYYYLTMAAGGGVYSGHHQLIARSRHVLGPYEPSPHGPMLIEHAPDAEFHHHGHAKFVQAADESWWCVYLMRRRLRGHSQLGRETGLDRITWADDGWPQVNGGRGPSDRAATVPQPLVRDTFDAPQLDVAWTSIRRPVASGCSLTARPGYLRLAGGTAGLDSRTDVGALLRRETARDYTATVALEFEPRAGEEAGLVCYYDTQNNFALVITEQDGPRLRLVARVRGVATVVQELPLPAGPRRELRLEVRGLTRRFSWRAPGAEWTLVATVPDCTGLSDEGTTQWGFTGTLVGVYARRTAAAPPLHADFDTFELRDDLGRTDAPPRP
jgi:xylan 1,4-beta-xylosidase